MHRALRAAALLILMMLLAPGILDLARVQAQAGEGAGR